MDVVVDDLEIPNERLAWMQASEDLRNPVYLRTESEVSRILTLVSRLSYVQHLSFQERFALTKAAVFRSVSAGEVILTARGNVRLLRDDVAALGMGTGGMEEDGAMMTSSPSHGSPRIKASAAKAELTAGSHSKVGLVLHADEVLLESRPVPEHVFLVVFGTVGLRVETVNGRVQSVLGKGDVVGSPLQEEALPPGSVYVALEPVELLSFTRTQYEELLAQVDAEELRQRVAFLKGLLVPILQPWSDDDITRLAKTCYPLRLQSKELVVKEGSKADAMYFLQSGKLKVVREVDFAAPPGGGGGLGLTGNSTAPFASQTAAAQHQVRLLELATLQEGEFFGELALIRYRVDENRKTNLSTLLSTAKSDSGMTSAPGASSSGRRAMHRSGGGRNKAVGGGSTTTSAFDTTGGASAMFLDDEGSPSEDSGDDDASRREVSEHKEPLTRQATVYAHTPATVLVLPRRCFMDCVRGPALVRLREYAKGYPSQQDIRNHFVRQEKWDAFKTDLINQVRGSKAPPPAKSAVARGRGGGTGTQLPSPRR